MAQPSINVVSEKHSKEELEEVEEAQAPMFATAAGEYEGIAKITYPVCSSLGELYPKQKDENTRGVDGCRLHES